MAMITNSDLTRAWTVSADHQLVSYDLTSDSTTSVKVWSTGHIGHASLALSPDGNVLAVGGWDGHIRLFSAATGKPLGDLDCHRESIHVLAFAHSTITQEGGTEVESTIELGDEGDSDEEETGSGGGVHRERWLVSGSKDRRVTLWELIDFTKSRPA
jgi:WD40 repeat protein